MTEQVEEVQEGEVREQPNALVINLELAQALVKYLDGQVHGEVRYLVAGLEQSRQVTVTQDSPEE